MSVLPLRPVQPPRCRARSPPWPHPGSQTCGHDHGWHKRQSPPPPRPLAKAWLASRAHACRCRRMVSISTTPICSAMARKAAPASIGCSCRASPTNTTLAPASRAASSTSAHLPAAHHPRLVDDQHIPAAERIAPPAPAIFEGVQRPAFDPGRGLQLIRRLPRQSRAPHPVALRLPGLARRCQRRRFARTRRTGNGRDLLLPGDVLNRLPLLFGQTWMLRRAAACR